MLSALVVLGALASSALAQSSGLSGLPSCVVLCATTKVQEGYCSSSAFPSAYAQCLTDNCSSGSDLSTGQAITQSQICAQASAAGVTATGTVSAAAAGITGGSGSMTATGSASAAMASASGNSSSGAAAYVSGLQAALSGAGLTTLAGLVPALAQNQTLATALTMGNKTVFGPTDAAFAAAGASSLPANQLSAILQYHILNGTFNASQVPTSPNVTFIRSLLNYQPYALLPGNAGQVVKIQRLANGSLAIGENRTVVSGNATFQNLQLQVIPSVLSVPGNLSTVLSSNANFSMLVSALSSASPQAVQMLSSIRGVTIFAPTNAAFSKISSALPQLSQNTTLLLNVLLNHVLNGTVAYSPTIASGNTTVTSASGQPLVIARSASGITVNVGSNVTANVVQPDIVVANGVVHGIDNVLVNTASDPNAAAAAASSAAAGAGAQATQGTGNSGGIGASGSSGSGSGNTGSGGSGGSGGSSGAARLIAGSAVFGLIIASGLAVIA